MRCKLLEDCYNAADFISSYENFIDCRLVDVRRDGKWSHYFFEWRALGSFKKFINELNAGKDGGALCK